MARQPDHEFRDMYELDHRVDAINPRNFFKGDHIISDQITREGLGVIWDELEHVLQQGITGDIVEFGCYVGTTSVYVRRLLDAYEQSENRMFHVYDSFEGLPEKTVHDESAGSVDFKAGALMVGKKELMNQFKRAGLRPPIAHKGWFSDITSEQVPPKIAFAFLDGDFYESIRDSLKLVLPNMQPGGIIVIDDYARETLPGAVKAVREVVPQRDFQRITVSQGMGILRL